MAQLVTINNKTHLKLTVDQSKVERHGAALHLVPAVMSEFTNMAVQYPLVMTKHQETGQFVFAAMLGFTAGENLFWRDEQWQGLYIPLQIRRQPFFISCDESDNTKYEISFDSESPAISSKNGQPLFNENGSETDFFQQAKACLSELISGEIANKYLAEKLVSMNLLQVMTMEVTFANKTSSVVKGLYTIDTEKLAALSTEQIASLHQDGLLQAIYTLITSLGQMHHLIDLKNKQLGC